jgi:NaMN:DMB phosphoribosyltransferase
MLKRYIDKKEAKRDEKEKTTEQLILMMLQMGKANNILAEATAKAVQRIPDAKCNGDMTAALAEAEKIKRKEKDFMFEQGVKHIFE